MNIHKNARLTPKGREILISRPEGGEHPGDVAGAMGVSVRTVCKWRQRFRNDGVRGLMDASPRPLKSPSRTPADIGARVVAVRRDKRIYEQIAAGTGLSRTTVARILMRHGLNRWRDLEPAGPVIRYERGQPGGLIHMDIRKPGASGGPDTASPVIGVVSPTHAEVPGAVMVGNLFMSPSTTIPDWPSARSWTAKPKAAPLNSSGPPSPGTNATASPSGG